jgi:hypothetical protein
MKAATPSAVTADPSRRLAVGNGSRKDLSESGNLIELDSRCTDSPPAMRILLRVLAGWALGRGWLADRSSYSCVNATGTHTQADIEFSKLENFQLAYWMLEKRQNAHGDV